jgi:ABC-2 type transport system permease protein
MNYFNGFWHHLLISLKLNFRNPQAIVMGYVVPIFFLLAFGSVFNSKAFRMADQMGQLLTISILGGACFGLPIAFVSERERGVWRRYKLTPMPTWVFVVSLVVGRYLLVLTAGIIQVGLAMAIYKMPMPKHPVQMLLAFTVASFAFLGIGLVIAMLANSATAVQAWGQALFLPMIMIGGIGIPLRMLPKWGLHVSVFLPGRYSLHAIEGAVRKAGVFGEWYSLFALILIGVAGFLAGVKLFRWENNQKVSKSSLIWVAVATGVWVVAGIGAEVLGLVKKL